MNYDKYGTRIKLLVELPIGTSANEIKATLRKMGCKVETHAIWLPIPLIDTKGTNHKVSPPDSMLFQEER